MSTILSASIATLAGAFLWTLGEYVLHRFAMHELGGRGILSREHLEHHVTAAWTWSPILLLAWFGVLLTGFLGWLPIGWLLGGPAVGVGLGTGWVVGYFFYEFQHVRSHIRPPANAYGSFVRRHHFHHHFGHPMANHGVTTPLWDRVFGTYEAPAKVRVPRRMALPWLVDEQGELRPEFADDYVLVGNRDATAHTAMLDRARAFASEAPAA